jgi:hypothetical protein
MCVDSVSMRPDKKADALVMPDSPEQFIDAAGWVFAETMLQIPHEYTRRGLPTAGVEPPPVEWHDWFAAYIREHGYRAKFGRRWYTYLELGEWKYWPYGRDVINRERLVQRKRGPRPRLLTARQRRSLEAAARQADRAEGRASEARAELARRIVEAHAGGSGASIREIASAVGLSSARVGELTQKPSRGTDEPLPEQGR